MESGKPNPGPFFEQIGVLTLGRIVTALDLEFACGTVARIVRDRPKTVQARRKLAEIIYEARGLRSIAGDRPKVQALRTEFINLVDRLGDEIEAALADRTTAPPTMLQDRSADSELQERAKRLCQARLNVRIEHGQPERRLSEVGQLDSFERRKILDDTRTIQSALRDAMKLCITTEYLCAHELTETEIALLNE